MAQSMDTLVVDASVAVKWLLADEENADQAATLLEEFANGRVNLIAPDLIRYEVSSAITVATQGQAPRLSREQGEKAIREFFGYGLRTAGGDDLILAAYPVVHQYGCALYDAVYLALAQRLARPFITADNRLYRRVSQLPSVLWIGHYSPSPSH